MVRVIPTVLIRGNQLVKGKQFNSWRSVGHAEQAARIYASRQCDEIILLDISATPEGRGPNIPLIEKWTDQNFAPITVGGGVRSIEDVRDLLNAGADKVAICTGGPALVSRCVDKFGSQAIVAAIDAKAGRAMVRCGTAETQQPAAGMADSSWMHGAGEILITSIDREGTLEGYDLELIKSVVAAVGCPVMAHGGCGTYEHMYEAIKAGASAVAAGAMFQFTEQTPRGAAQYLASKGIEVRL